MHSHTGAQRREHAKTGKDTRYDEKAYAIKSVIGSPRNPMPAATDLSSRGGEPNNNPRESRLIPKHIVGVPVFPPQTSPVLR